MKGLVLAALEFSSIAIGIKSLDEMVKIAPIKILDARTLSPGKYLVVFSGDVASVEYSYIKGCEIGENFIIDKVFLPQVHQNVVPAIGQTIKTDEWNCIGIIETNSVISSIEAADEAAKMGNVTIIEIRLAIGFGAKSYVKLMGTLDEVQAAIEAGSAKAKSKGMFFMDMIIPHPHEEIKPYFM